MFVANHYLAVINTFTPDLRFISFDIRPHRLIIKIIKHITFLTVLKEFDIDGWCHARSKHHRSYCNHNAEGYIMIKRTLMNFTLIFGILFASNVWALPEEKRQDILTFTKEFIMKESKNSGIFSLKHPETGAEEWFELYGILSDVKVDGGRHVVTVDVELFGYSDRNYLLYFVINDVEGGYTLEEIKIGPRFVREDAQELTIPE